MLNFDFVQKTQLIFVHRKRMSFSNCSKHMKMIEATSKRPAKRTMIHMVPSWKAGHLKSAKKMLKTRAVVNSNFLREVLKISERPLSIVILKQIISSFFANFIFFLFCALIQLSIKRINLSEEKSIQCLKLNPKR